MNQGSPGGAERIQQGEVPKYVTEVNDLSQSMECTILRSLCDSKWIEKMLHSCQ